MDDLEIMWDDDPPKRNVYGVLSANMSNLNEIIEKFPTDPAYIGAIIGLNGSNIKSIKTKFNVNVHINSDNHIVTVKGRNRKNVDDAVKYILEIIKHSDQKYKNKNKNKNVSSQNHEVSHNPKVEFKKKSFVPRFSASSRNDNIQVATPKSGFQRPPPMYTARGRVPMNAVATPGGNVISPAQQYRAMKQQQAQKERLLQQQQKQQLLVPESATARNDQLCLNPGINNIGTLLNTTVAPNVSLSRTNMPSDSQLSPNFAQSMMQQQLSPGQRNALFSPQPNQGYVPQYPQNAQRLSPQQQQQLNQQANAQQQQQLSFQNAQGQGGVSVAAQLSPRQPTYGAGNAGGNAGVVQSPGMSNASPQQWVAAAAAVAANNANNAAQRGGHSLQQHNPMLSAQLQGVSPYNARQYQSQRRGLNSPSGAVPGSMTTVTLQRQNSFQTNDSGFSGPSTSPSPQSPYGAGTTVFQQQQMQRMQRQSSVPQATQHLPGSPRPFGGTNSSNLDNGGVVGVNNTLSGNISINGGNGGVIPISGNGYGGAAGMMYNNMPSQGGPHTPNDFYGRTQTGKPKNCSYKKHKNPQKGILEDPKVEDAKIHASLGKHLTDAILNFYECDENSQVMPGKKDCVSVKIDGKRTQM
ncbi:transcription activator MSS11-like [Teleopsis dalmanni]|uniref:transcription activator MSS11-like n=1 Tax=Teleopsis dalmanni TaxID=139649 RepID=UPI0018CDCA10|nr:transcription activator MSS11-like [Teleopsis dalmanni]